LALSGKIRGDRSGLPAAEICFRVDARGRFQRSGSVKRFGIRWEHLGVSWREDDVLDVRNHGAEPRDCAKPVAKTWN